MNERACPSCGSTIHAPWGRKGGYDLVRCVGCGLVFVFPLPKDPPDIYGAGYFSGAAPHGYADYDRDKEPMRGAFGQYLDHLERSLGRTGKILDVGCATGYFMAVAAERGWEVEGIEISEHASELGRARGLKIHTGALPDEALASGSFDAVTFFDVLEHLPDPVAALKEAFRLLRPGGVVAITVPDASSFLARTLRARWHLVVPPEHLVFFNRKNLSVLLSRLGFVPQKAKTIGKSFTLPYIFQTLHRWQGLSLWEMLARATSRGPLSRLRIPLNLHDTFFLIAEKP